MSDRNVALQRALSELSDHADPAGSTRLREFIDAIASGSIEVPALLARTETGMREVVDTYASLLDVLGDAPPRSRQNVEAVSEVATITASVVARLLRSACDGSDDPMLRDAYTDCTSQVAFALVRIASALWEGDCCDALEGLQHVALTQRMSYMAVITSVRVNSESRRLRSDDYEAASGGRLTGRGSVWPESGQPPRLVRHRRLRDTLDRLAARTVDAPQGAAYEEAIWTLGASEHRFPSIAPDCAAELSDMLVDLAAVVRCVESVRHDPAVAQEISELCRITNRILSGVLDGAYSRPRDRLSERAKVDFGYEFALAVSIAAESALAGRGGSYLDELRGISERDGFRYLRHALPAET